MVFLRLTRRLALIIVPAVFLGLITVFTLTSVFVLQNFMRVEAAEEHAQLHRIEAGIFDDVDHQDTTARDWSHWTETYDYILGTNPAYVELNLSPKSYEANHWAYLLIVDANEAVVNGTTFDPATSTFHPLPPELATPEARAAIGLQPFTTDDGHIAGIVTVQGQPHMVSAWSVLTNEETGPRVGTMMWFRSISGDYAAQFAKDLDLDLRILAWEEATDAPKSRLTAPNEPLVETSLFHDEAMRSWTRLDDIAGRPAVAIEHNAPRTIYQQGLQTMTVAFVAAAAVGGAFLILAWLLIRHYVTGPVMGLSRRIGEIQAGSSDRSLPIGHHDDEVTAMAKGFGQLLRTVDEREQQLLAKNRDLDRFASVVSHDLLSPLSTVNASVHVLQADLERKQLDKAEAHLDRIKRTSKTMEDRVKAVLDFARAGRNMAPPGPVDAGAVLKATLADMAHDIESAGANITAAALPVVLAVQEPLKQVMQNLISNAIKYHKPGEPPTLRILANRDGDEHRITFADDGVGFAESEVPQMLTPFQRLDRTRDLPGHGIGLASCARIMERMGGRLELRGDVGIGARVSVVLPAAP